MQVDHLSDIHIDIWIDPKYPEYVQREYIRKFILQFIPAKPSRVLIVAGDIGHDNEQNKLLFEILREFYEIVLWTEGNHDLLLLTKEARLKFSYDSFKRLQDMIKLSSEVDGVFYLSGPKEVDGKVFGGFPMWYDMAYGVEVCYRAPIFLRNLWKQWMIDADYIFVKGDQRPGFDWVSYAKAQKENLENHFRKCDVIFSHVSPDWSQLKSHYRDEPISTFFHFDGRKILEECAGKTWIFGHTHDMYDYHVNGCRLISNPLGYPSERGSIRERDIEGFQIRTISI